MNLMKVGAFLKKWGPWVVFPIGVLMLIGKFLRPKVVVSSPELAQHAELKKKLDEQATVKKKQAEVAHQARTASIDEKYTRKVSEAQEAAAKKVDELRNDPVSLNDYLKRTGRDVRAAKK